MRRPIALVVIFRGSALTHSILALDRRSRDKILSSPDLVVPVLYVAQSFRRHGPLRDGGVHRTITITIFLYLNRASSTSRASRSKGVWLIKLQFHFHPGNQHCTATARRVAYVDRRPAPSCLREPWPPFVMRFRPVAAAGRQPPCRLQHNENGRPSFRTLPLQGAPIVCDPAGRLCPPPFGASQRPSRPLYPWQCVPTTCRYEVCRGALAAGNTVSPRETCASSSATSFRWCRSTPFVGDCTGLNDFPSARRNAASSYAMRRSVEGRCRQFRPFALVDDAVPSQSRSHKLVFTPRRSRSSSGQSQLAALPNPSCPTTSELSISCSIPLCTRRHPGPVLRKVLWA